MRPSIDAALIADLRTRVVHHNEAHPMRKTKLAELLKVYERGFRGGQPGVRAIGRVEAHLGVLAKADDFDEAEHPRGGNGEFSSSGGSGAPAETPLGERLPGTRAEHKALQRSNAGYRALTTDVIPDTRHEALGGALRDAASLAGGAAVVAGLARNKKGRGIENLAAKAGRVVVGSAAGAAGAVAGAVTQKASVATHNLVGFPKPLGANTARIAGSRAAAAGRVVGDAVGRYPTRVAGSLVQASLAGAGSSHVGAAAHKVFKARMAEHVAAGLPAAEARRMAFTQAKRFAARTAFGRKALLFGTLAGATGLAIRSQVKDSILDPAAIGRSWDAFSFREIEKAVGASGELGDAFDHMRGVLAKDAGHAGSIEGLRGWLAAGGGGRELRKSTAGIWGRPAASVFLALAGAGGAALGAASGHLAVTAHNKRGNPNHDEHGRFTSASGGHEGAKQKGIVAASAVAGGLGAGIAVWAALRRHNARATLVALGRLHSHFENLVDAIGRGTTPRLRAALATSDKRIKEIVDTHKAVAGIRDEIAHVKAHGASAEPFFKDALQESFHGRLAEMLAGFDEVKLPGKAGWRPLREAAADNPAFARGRATQRAVLTDTVRQHLDAGMTGEQFTKAVAGLEQAHPGVHREVQALFAKSRADIGDVPMVLKAHHEKIRAAQGAFEAAETAQAKAGNDVLAAQAAHSAATEPAAQAKAARAVAKAEKVADALDDATDAAKQRLDQLRANPTGIEDPFTHEPILPPNPRMIDDKVRGLEVRAREKGQAIFLKEIAALKEREIARVSDRHARARGARAVQAKINGLPGAVHTELKGFADAETKLRGAEGASRAARAAAAQPARDFSDLGKLRGTATGAPKGMTAERAKHLRDNAPAITTAHTDAQATLAAAETERHRLHAELHAADGVVRQALAERVGAKPRELIPPEARRDLRRARVALAKPWRDFIARPTGQKLLELAGGAKAYGIKAAATTLDGMRTGTQRAFNDFFTYKAPGGEVRFSPRKALESVGPVLAFGPAVVGTGVYLKDRFLGGEEGRARAAGNHRGIQIEGEGRDPLTGAGYVGLSIPHPSDPRDRMLVWGERTDGHGQAPKPIYGGSRVSDVRSRMRQHSEEQRQRQKNANSGGGSTGGDGERNPQLSLDPEKAADVGRAQQALHNDRKLKTVDGHGGPSIRVRDEADEQHNGAAGHVMNRVRELRGKDGSPSGDAYHATLAGLFSRQGEVLKAGQVYRELTGYGTNGNKDPKHKPIFGQQEGFGAKDPAKVAGALGAEIKRVLPSANTPARLANLHRAVALVGAVKGVDADTLKPLLARMRGGQGQQADGSSPSASERRADSPRPAAAEPSAAPRTPGTALTVIRPSVDLATPRFDPARPLSREARTDFDQDRMHLVATRHAQMLADRLDHGDDEEFVDGLTGTIFSQGRNLAAAYSNLAPEKAVEAVAKAVGDLYDKSTRKLDPKKLHDSRALYAAMASHAQMMSKGVMLDDLDVLVKAAFGEEIGQGLGEAFNASEHPRASGGEAGGGEFVSNGHAASGAGHSGALGGKLAGEAAEAGGKLLGREARGVTGKTQAWDNPVRLGTEVGGAFGAEATLRVVQALLPAPIRTIGKVGMVAAEGIGSLLGNVGGSMGGEAAGNVALRAGGHRSEEFNGPEMGTKETIGSTLGTIGGGVIGNKLGQLGGTALAEAGGAWAGRALGGTVGAALGPVGSVALGTALGYAGDYAGRAIGRWFDGHDQATASSAMQRFGTPKPPKPPRTPGAAAGGSA